jgi:CHAT domain-containing protein/tetratricopeptide (TPR) repeat protein
VNTRVIQLQDAEFEGDRTSTLQALWVALAMLVVAAPATATGIPCAKVLEGSGKVLERHWMQRGSTTVRIDLLPANARNLFIRVTEQGIDVEVEIQDRDGVVIARSDSPIERSASQHTYMPASGPLPSVAVVRAKEPAQIEGAVGLYISALPGEGEPRPKDVGDCSEALKKWAEADADYASGREIALARSVSSVTNAQSLFKAATQAYQAALADLAGPTHIRDQAELQLSAAAVFYYELQSWATSALLASESAATFARAGDSYLRARSQAILAAAWMEMATKSASPQQGTDTPRDSSRQLDRSRALLSELATFHAHRRERYEEALQINNIGLADFYEGRYELAIPYFSLAKTAFERLGETSRAAVALQNQALCEWGLGRLSAALPEFDQALGLLRPTLYPDLYLLTLNNSGVAHYAAGRFDDSLRLQTEALDFATRSQADRARARSYYGIGLTYYAIGDRELASRFLHSALAICTADLDARIRMATLRSLAVLEHESGQFPSAISHNSEALVLATDPSARARILLQLARDYADSGERARALQLLSRLMLHPPSDDPLVQGLALVERGTISRASGHFAASEKDLIQGLRILVRFDALAERFDAEVELARLRAEQHHTVDALAGIHRALGMSREIRAQTANPEYRASIVQSLRPALDFEIQLLRDRYDALVLKGQPAAARMLAVASLKAVDDFRAQGFEDWRAQHFDNQSDKRVQALLNASTALYHEMAERRFQLSARIDLAGPLDSRAIALREDIGRLRARVGVVNAELAARTSNVSISSREPFAPANWPGQLKTLPDDRALLEYWLGSSRAFAWVVTRAGVTWVPLADSSTIARAARRLHDAMKSSATVSVAARLEDCVELYGLIFAPLAKPVGAAVNLIVVPDGALNYVPFAALRSTTTGENSYLVQRVVLSIAPALRLLHTPATAAPLDDGAPTVNRALIVADPIYTTDDTRLSANSPIRPKVHLIDGDGAVPTRGVDPSHLTRLVSTAREAAQISSLYEPEDVDLLEGSDATRENFLARDLASYRFIHIASHGIIDAEIPQLSALVLGTYGSHGAVNDPYVRVSDLLAKTFKAQAVVLSACDTALGKEFAGEGIIGLRYAALARGAHAVVASLWSVSDGISADLMTDMYRQMTTTTSARSRSFLPSASQAVASSLSIAMRHMLEQTPALDPALWAPFTVYVAEN